MRGLLRALVLTLVLVLGAGGAAVAVSQTAWFRNWLRGFIVTQSSQFLNGQLAIGRLDGNLFYGIELGDVTIMLDGQPVISLRDVVLRYNAWELLTSGLSIDELRVSRAHVFLRAEGDGWQVSRLIKRQEEEADREGPTRPFSVDRIIVVDGAMVIEPPPGQGVSIPKQVDGLGFVGSFSYEPVRYTLKLESMALRTSAPELNLTSLSGAIAVKDDTVFVEQLALATDGTAFTIAGDVQQYLSRPDFNVQLTAPRVSLPEIARFVPAAAGIDLEPSLDVKVDGPLDAMAIELFTRSRAGEIKATLHADVAAPGQSVMGDVSVQHLNLAPLLNDPAQASDITGDAKLDLSAPALNNIAALRGSVSANARVAMAGYTADRLDLKAQLTAGKAAQLRAELHAYGATATTAGTVSLPDGDTPVRFNLTGRVQRLNLRTLPKSLAVPPVVTNLNASYRVAGLQPMGNRRDRDTFRLAADARVASSVVPGARLEDGSRVQVSVVGRAIAYKAEATVTDVDLHEIGRAFAVPALADDRYKSKIAGHITAEGRGTDIRTLDADAAGTITSAELMGGRLGNLQFSGGLHQDTIRLDARGTFAGFDPATLSGKPAAKGDVSGEFALQGAVTALSRGVTVDSVSGDVRATLAPSTVGGLAIERASLDASYAEQLATVRELDVAGRDANLHADGTVALGESGESALTFHADSPSLIEVGRIFEVPVAGIARVDGTLSGNRTLLIATGTLEGDGLQYKKNGALALRTQFTMRVPDLTFGNATATAESRATFVTLSGQNINEVNATTTYDQQQVDFTVRARQPQRQLDAAGQLTLHPDHQEVHLDSLALQATGQQWQIPEQQRPTINYGSSALRIENLRLVNGDQEIVADGGFGAPGESLNIELRNVDLASIDALLLRPPQFTGRLNAKSVVSGTTAAPAATADFAVNSGGFRQFLYESLAGHVEYAGQGLTLDTRLQQNATQWITAKGYLPTTLFSGAQAENADAGGAHIPPATPVERVDLTIDSSPLGLGLLQGFTTVLADVNGTAEVHLRITGSAADPHPEGTITIADGTMTVVPNGVTYSHIAGKVELRPDRVHIDSIVVLDNHQSALSLSGDLGVHARDVGDVQLWLTAEDFKILDNQMGNVRVNSAIEIAGELSAPVIQGDFGVSTGRIDLDEIIALAGPSAYSTTPTEFVTQGSPIDASSGAVADGEARPSVFDALKMRLRLQVPNDLVVKANRLQAPGATVALGALNVTLGGDLLALKDPRGPVRLTGEVNTVRGTYDFQGRRFEILRDGTVRFDGGERLNPLLDVRTRRDIRGVEALVTVRGTLDRPEVILASTPPLEQADILSLIVFNQPINQLGEGQAASLSTAAQSLAAGVVAGQLAAQIGGALNLDTFEINVGPESGATAEVTIGQQLGKDLYVKVQQGVGYMTSTNVIIEYAFSRWLRLQTNILQGTSAQQSLFRPQMGSGADLIVLFTK